MLFHDLCAGYAQPAPRAFSTFGQSRKTMPASIRTLLENLARYREARRQRACKLQAQEVHRSWRVFVLIVRSAYRVPPQMGHRVTKGARPGVLSPPPERAHAYTQHH